MDAAYHSNRARQGLRGRWGNAVLACWIAGVLCGGVLIPGLEFYWNTELGLRMRSDNPLIQMILVEWLPDTTAGSLFRTAVLCSMLLLGGPVRVIWARYRLSLIDGLQRGRRMCPQEFRRAMGMQLLIFLLALIGLRLYMLPSVAVIWFCRFAPLVLAMEPECSSWNALGRSAALVWKNGRQLLALEMRLLGWAVLSMFTGATGGLFLQPYRASAFASLFLELYEKEGPVARFQASDGRRMP